MKDERRTKTELIEELVGMRRRVAESSTLEKEHKLSVQELEQSIEKLQRAMKGTAYAIALAVELRDPYTAGHHRNVAKLAGDIAKEMGLSEDEIEGIHLAATIHDVGRVAIPFEILSKPGSLTEAEFLMVKGHPKLGYHILKMVESPWPITQIVLQHHERMDGSGYPQGLSGKDILLGARILAVADVVEAMASHRPYRPPHVVNKALEEISHNKDTLYV